MSSPIMIVHHSRRGTSKLHLTCLNLLLLLRNMKKVSMNICTVQVAILASLEYKPRFGYNYVPISRNHLLFVVSVRHRTIV